MFYGIPWEQGPCLSFKTTALSTWYMCIYVFAWTNEKYPSCSSSSNYRRNISNKNQEIFVVGLSRTGKKVHFKDCIPLRNKVGTNSQQGVPDLPQSTPGRMLWHLHFFTISLKRANHRGSNIFVVAYCQHQWKYIAHRKIILSPPLRNESHRKSCPSWRWERWEILKYTGSAEG